MAPESQNENVRTMDHRLFDSLSVSVIYTIIHNVPINTYIFHVPFFVYEVLFSCTYISKAYFENSDHAYAHAELLKT